VHAKANNLPVERVSAVFDSVSGPGGPFEITEGYLRTDSGSTAAPHLQGPKGNGQRYRYFKNGPHLLGDWYTTFCTRNDMQDFIVYQESCTDVSERFSYREALAVASGLGAFLIEDIGVGKGDRVAQISRNYPEWMLSFMAATMVGCVAVPTNSLWNMPELEYGMNDSGTVVAFIDGERAERILPLCREGRLPKMKAVIVGRDQKHIGLEGGGAVKVLKLNEVMLASKGRTAPQVSVFPEDNATIMYTSGTTGHPKGVVSTHRAITQALIGALFYGMCAHLLTPKREKKSSGGHPRLQESILCPVPLFHATGSHSIFLLSFILGRKVVLMHKWNPVEALRLVECEKVTSFVGVPTMSMEMLTHPEYSKFDTSTLKSVGGGGAAPPKKLSEQTVKQGKKAGQGWGLTESNALTVNTSSSEDYAANPSSCGRAAVHIDIKIVDDSNSELPPGGVGEVLIRGPTMLKEYWNKPEATAKAISVDGWFRTGDIGKLDPDGALYILDRAKDLIIRGGENISCAEVETALYEHPSVQEAAVFGMPDERLGEVVAAAIVPRDGLPSFSGPDLAAFCSERLARFKVPTEIYAWPAGQQLPRGATGKTPKREIRQQIQDGTAPCIRLLPPPARM